MYLTLAVEKSYKETCVLSILQLLFKLERLINSKQWLFVNNLLRAITIGLIELYLIIKMNLLPNIHLCKHMRHKIETFWNKGANYPQQLLSQTYVAKTDY